MKLLTRQPSPKRSRSSSSCRPKSPLAALRVVLLLESPPAFRSRNLFVSQRIPLAGVAHQVGTVRFGNDPKSSALDANCKAHDLDNLYVVDGSFFVSSGAVNPALTIIANALRVGVHLIERMG